MLSFLGLDSSSPSASSSQSPWDFFSTPTVAPLPSLAYSSAQAKALCDKHEDSAGSSTTIWRYLIDNRYLRSGSPGLAYRRSKLVTDKHREELAPWGTEVAGKDIGDGWLQVGKLFLPFEVDGEIVLSVSGSGLAQGQCLTCSSFGRNPFFCFYSKVKEGACVLVNAEFESINRERNVLKPGMRGIVLEVDADEDRRVQFQDFEKAQWVAFHKVLFLTIIKEGQDSDTKDPESVMRDVNASSQESSSDDAPWYASYMAWLFGQASPKEVTCLEGHRCKVDVSDDRACSSCAGPSTHYACSEGCAWSVCYMCYNQILARKVTLDGKWIKGDQVETISGNKVIFAGGEVHELKLTNDTSCVLTLDGEDYGGDLTADGLKIAWNDGDVWLRSLRDDFIQMQPKLDVRAALDELRLPNCSECQAPLEWTAASAEGVEREGRWTCVRYSSCGSKGSKSRYPWRWHCRDCSYSLCCLCGPQIPTPLETLRPQTVPIFEEWLTAGCPALKKASGSHYHEVRLGQGLNSPHIGWLTQCFKEKEFDGHGVGTNAHGWAADGIRNLKWHCGCVSAVWPRDWQEYDIIGCAIDIDSGNMEFSLNGVWVPEASMTFHGMNYLFFPAVSMNGDFEFFISSDSWHYSPPDDDYQAWAERGVYSRPKTSQLRLGDRVRVEENCMSNSRDPVKLRKGQLGTVREIDADGDTLIDFEEQSKGEWIFRSCFERLRVPELMRILLGEVEVAKTLELRPPTEVFELQMSCIGGRLPSIIEVREEEDLSSDMSSRVGDGLCTPRKDTPRQASKDPLPKVREIPSPPHINGKRTPALNSLVGIWDFAGGTFDVECQDEKLFFYGSELKPEDGSAWMLTKLPKTGVSYRLRLNHPRGNVLVWQEMGKGGDAWEATHYATRRGRMSDGAKIVTTMQASIWGSVHSGHELGLAPGGAALVLAGPRVQGDGLWMAPVRPRGAVELRCIRLDEPLDIDIEAVDTNSLSGYEGQKYDSLESIWDALEDGDTQLIKGSWLKGLAAQNGILARRQELPSQAAWEPLELQVLVEQRRIQIVSISYCWLTLEHPDPNGVQLKTIANIVEQRLDESTIPLDDLALFIDWCSLYQEPRRDHDEERAYKRGFKTVNLWYAHAQTMVWLLTVVPDGVERFENRGWPTFERAVSVMLTESSKLLDLGKVNDTCTRWFHTCKACAMQRQPPLVPAVFDKDLQSKIFALETDRATVEKKYAQTFHEVMASAKFLEFQALGWDPPQVATFAEALPYCRALTKLTLTENEVGTAAKIAENGGDQSENEDNQQSTEDIMPDPVAAKALAINLPKVSTLRQVLCRGCNIADQDMVILAAALPRCMALVTLNLQDNKFGPTGTVALAQVLPECERLGLLYLTSNRVGEEGAMALAKFAPACDTLRELWVTDAGDLGDGKNELIVQWRQKGKAEGFLHL